MHCHDNGLVLDVIILQDVAAIQTLPLPGHKVKALETSDKTNVFTLTHKDITVCNFQADSEAQFHQ